MLAQVPHAQTPEAPQVATASSGQFMAAWRQQTTTQGGEGVFGRTLSSSGAPAGASTRVDPGSATEVSTPFAAADAAGNVMVVWHQRAPSGTLDGGDGVAALGFEACQLVGGRGVVSGVW